MPKLAPQLEPTKPQLLVPTQIWALLFALPVVLWVFAPEWKPALRSSTYHDAIVQVKPPELLGSDEPTSFTLRGAWEPSGEVIIPADDASFDIEMPAGYWDGVTIRILGAGEWTVRLRRDVMDPLAGRQIMTSMQMRDLAAGDDGVLDANDIPGVLHGENPLRVSISPRPGTGAALASVRVRCTSDARNGLYFFPGIAALGLAPFVCALFLRLGYGFGIKRSVTGGIAGGIGALILIFKHPDAARILTGIIIGISLAAAVSAFFASRGWRWRQRKLEVSDDDWRAAAFGMLVVGVLLTALFTRWNAFEVARRSPLGWDASGYLQIALKGGALYATSQDFAPWVREPMLPWLLRAWFVFAPGTDASARFLSMLLSIGAVGAVLLVGRRLVGVFPALAAAMMMTLAPHWSSLAVQVLRLDMMVLLLMGAFACRIWLEDKHCKRAAGFGFVGAGLALSRISQLFFVGVIGIWEVLRRRWKPAEIAIAAGIVVVLVVPHLAYNYRYEKSGDLFYSSTVHSRYYLNREHLGEPGYPADMAEYNRDPYVGEPLSSAKYLFKHHTLIELLVGHVKGYWLMFVWGSPREDIFAGREWLMLPGLLGAWVMLRTRRWWIWIWFVVSAFPYAFITSVHHAWRLGGEAQILVMWLWGLGVREIAVKAYSLYINWRRKPPLSPSGS